MPGAIALLTPLAARAQTTVQPPASSAPPPNAAAPRRRQWAPSAPPKPRRRRPFARSWSTPISHHSARPGVVVGEQEDHCPRLVSAKKAGLRALRVGRAVRLECLGCADELEPVSWVGSLGWTATDHVYGEERCDDYPRQGRSPIAQRPPRGTRPHGTPSRSRPASRVSSSAAGPRHHLGLVCLAPVRSARYPSLMLTTPVARVKGGTRWASRNTWHGRSRGGAWTPTSRAPTAPPDRGGLQALQHRRGAGSEGSGPGAEPDPEGLGITWARNGRS
jgi:hypothetical protein